MIAKSNKNQITTKSSSPNSDIKTTDAPALILKKPVAFGNDVMAIAIHRSLVKYFGITEATQIEEEIVEGVGILLRIVRKDVS